MENIIILGSTGSIGTQALEVLEEQKEHYRAYGLVGCNNVELLIKQSKKFLPAWVGIGNEEHFQQLKEALKGLPIKVVAGESGIDEIVSDPVGDTVLAAISGFAGLKSTVTSIKNKKKIALANKETLVAGGEYILDLLKEHKNSLTPVDSEHSAIFQCLKGNEEYLKKIILTASGGAFRDYPEEKLQGVTVKEALKHPNWSMGTKITIDSATLANKGLEVIEAHYLFDCPYDKIEVVIHKESIVHSLVELEDTAVLAQLGYPSMKIPILYGLSYPRRLATPYKGLDLSALGSLSFSKPNKVFRALSLAFEAGKEGGSAPIIYNRANEVAVQLFLEEQISFLEIYDVIETGLEDLERIKIDSLEAIYEMDRRAKDYLLEKFSKVGR